MDATEIQLLHHVDQLTGECRTGTPFDTPTTRTMKALAARRPRTKRINRALRYLYRRIARPFLD